jgi:hypothetical protein
MSGVHFLLERIDIKALRFATSLALNGHRATPSTRTIQTYSRPLPLTTMPCSF